MRFEDAFSTRAAGIRITQDVTAAVPYMAKAFFPHRKQTSLDLKMVKAHKGLTVALKPSAFDTIPTIRTRGNFSVTSMKLPFFREGFQVSEEDIMKIHNAREVNDPYLLEALRRIYDDAAELYDAANVAAEKMRCSLLAPVNGNAQFSVSGDNAIYNYNYDPDGTWKTAHYIELTGADMWSAPTTAKPLNDIREAKQVLIASGYTAQYAVMNSATFDYLIENDQMRNALVTVSGVTVDFIDDETARELFRRKTGLNLVLYDKMYKDIDGTDKKFFPDGYVSIASGILGDTAFGPTPEEVTGLVNANADVSILDEGIALSRVTTYGPPYQEGIFAAMAAAPSFENMDGLCVLKVA